MQTLKTHIRHGFAFTAILLLLTGCGFTLRNQNKLPTPLRTLYLQAANPYGEFESTLRQTLSSSGIRLVESKQQAPLTLRIISTNSAVNSPSIGPSSETRIYTITYTVTFDITDGKDKVVIPTQSASTSNNLTLSANQLLQSNNQLHLLEQDMRRDVISQIYNRLTSTYVREKLVKSKL